METNIDSPSSEVIDNNLDSVPLVQFPVKKLSKKFWIKLSIPIILLVLIITYLSLGENTSATPEAQITNKSIIQKMTDNIQSAVEQTNSKEVESSPSPVPSPNKSSIDDIINLGDYQEKPIEFQKNDGPSVDKENLNIKIPSLQSRKIISPVFAADLQTLYPIYMQNPTVDTLDNIAIKLGIQAKATRPESNKEYYLEYIDPQSKLIYDPSEGSLSYESIPDAGELPSYTKAEELARSMLASLGISLKSEQAKVVSSSISSIYENFASVHPAIAVNFMDNSQNLPVVYSDIDFFSNTAEIDSLSPKITVLITGGGKITRIFYGTYAQYLGPNPITMNDRTLSQAVDELKTYGGHIRNIVQLEEQRTNFACADNVCGVHDATITKAYRGYNWGHGLSGLSYYEINDLSQRAFDYLLPVWIFEGTGMMDKARTDDSGKLIPNPDKTNNDQFYRQKVRFTSTIPGFTHINDVNLLELKNYTLESIDDHQAKVTFQTKYLFPTFSGASFAQAEPRNGMKYKLLVLFPDKTYSIINGYKQEVYPGEVTFDIGSVKGEITTYLELPDFSNNIEKRTLIVQ